MGTSKNYSRRDFLKASGVASSALLFSSCTSMQNTFSGEKSSFDEEVMILGAGVAGLAAAYTLKKNKIPFRIFEASPRVGGRVYTLQNFTQTGLSAELGAEFFDESHRRIFQICKELSIDPEEVKANSDERLYSLRGELYGQADFRKKLKPLYAQLAQHHTSLFFNRDILLTVDNIAQYDKALYYDSMSADDFIRSLSTEVDLLTLEIFLLQIRTRFGIDPKLLSALQLLSSFSRDGVLNYQGTKSQYRFPNGSDQLVQTLYERVAGVIPDFILKVDAAVVSIAAKTSDFEVGFKIGGRSRTYKAKQIICTLPFSCLREVDGINKLNFSSAKKDLIQAQIYTNQTKAVLEFNESFWKKKTATHPAFGSGLTGDIASQCFYDGAQGQKPTGAILSVLRNAHLGEPTDRQIVRDAIQDLEKLHKTSAALLGSAQSYMTWGDRPFSKGGRAVFSPLQFYKYSGVAAKPEYDGAFLFAGEHTSVEFAGTMEGAIQSGIAAAESILKRSAVRLTD